MLNFVNVIGQIYFLDLFLGGEFTTYGRDVVAMTELEPENRSDPMSKVRLIPFSELGSLRGRRLETRRLCTGFCHRV